MSKAILIIDMPEHCYECPLENTKRCPFLWEDVESLDKPKDCPLKPYKEAIPLEWLEKNYGGLQIVRYIMKDWEIHDSVVVPYSDELPNIIFETTTKEIPMAWIKAYTRTAISNADFWAITRMVTRWEEGKEIRERHEI